MAKHEEQVKAVIDFGTTYVNEFRRHVLKQSLKTSALVSVLSAVCIGAQAAGTDGQAVPASPAPVPPNASRISAQVLKYAIWPPGLLKNTLPPVLPERTLYSYQIEIHTVEPAQPGLESYAQPGTAIDVFSLDALASQLVGTEIRATVTLTGDTRGVRWWISNIEVKRH
jgi:hypothetical protein